MYMGCYVEQYMFARLNIQVSSGVDFDKKAEQSPRHDSSRSCRLMRSVQRSAYSPRRAHAHPNGQVPAESVNDNHHYFRC